MKRRNFLWYGAWIGARYAIKGSTVFAFLFLCFLFTAGGSGISTITFGDLGLTFSLLVISAFLSVVTSVLPGALGGVYLACWLGSLGENVPASNVVNWRSGIVGGLAGLVSSGLAIALFGELLYDTTLWFFVLWAILIAAGMGQYGVKKLLSKRSTFVLPDDSHHSN